MTALKSVTARLCSTHPAAPKLGGTWMSANGQKRTFAERAISIYWASLNGPPWLHYCKCSFKNASTLDNANLDSGESGMATMKTWIIPSYRSSFTV